MGPDKGYVFGTNRKRTICEVLRDINDQFQGDSEQHRQARDFVVCAMLQAKSMICILARLRQARGQTTDLDLGTISDWLFQENTREHMTQAHRIRANPNYKVGGKYS